MKICPNCQAEVEDNFDLCWNCEYSFTDNKVVEIKEDTGGSREIDCLRCAVPMRYAGNFRFHEGFLTGVFTNKESFDLYVCPQCGKVEFFVPDEENPNILG
jgi:Zn finger protein HypA/HybF involved in hydrogenase expression